MGKQKTSAEGVEVADEEVGQILGFGVAILRGYAYRWSEASDGDDTAHRRRSPATDGGYQGGRVDGEATKPFRNVVEGLGA